MAAEPSRALRPAFPATGFLHPLHAPIHGLMRQGDTGRAAELARVSARLAEEYADLPTVVTTRLLESIALGNGGRTRDADRVSRSVLALVDSMNALDAEAIPGDGDGAPAALPRHACFWRAEALALLARSAVGDGVVLAAMDHLADALATIDAVPPTTEDDAVACLVLSTALTSVLLLEPAAELVTRGLALTDRLIAGTSPELDLGFVRTSLARRLAETHALWAEYLAMTGAEHEARERYAVAASAALRHRNAARQAGDLDEEAGAAIFLALAEHGMQGWRPVPLLDLADEATVSSAVDRLGRVVAVGPGRGGELLGRIVLARLLAGRGAREEARAVLEAGEPGRPASLWGDVADVVRARIEDDAGHPAVALWRDLAVAAVVRIWRERDARFVDLRQRIIQRQLRWRRAATEGELLRDPLTGLGNRRRLAVELDRELSSVLFIDIDRFKVINDECSHEVGDLVLRRIAGILRSCCRSPDVVVRYGGDEFVVVLDRGSSALALGERVLERVRLEDWSPLTGSRRVTVSVGAASAATLREALRESDAAMLAAKAGGRDALVLVDR